MNQTFQSIFSEYPTAQKFQFEPDKLKYVINWGLPPHFKDLKTKLQNSEFLVTSFDESLKKSTQNFQMDIGICFWSQEATQVKVRYWDSQFLLHATSGDLLQNFNKSLVGLNLSKIIQISLDGPSVSMMKLLRTERKSDKNIKATAKDAFQILYTIHLLEGLITSV